MQPDLSAFIQKLFGRIRQARGLKTDQAILNLLPKPQRVHIVTLRKWKNGTQVPDVRNLELLLNLLGLRISDCLYFPDEVSHYRDVELALTRKRDLPKPAS